MSRRSWYTGIVVIGKTTSRTVGALRSHGLGPMIPLLLYLLLGAALLWIVNTIAPLAPFVYSLF
jgi:hypothetical protein